MTEKNRGRLIFNDTLRRPGKVRELAMGYSASVPLAREFRDAYRDLYREITVCWLVGYNPQMLLTDQRTDEQKIDYAVRQAWERRLDAFYDEIIAYWVHEGKLPDFASGGVVTGRFSEPPRTATEARGEYVFPRPRAEDLYRKG